MRLVGRCWSVGRVDHFSQEFFSVQTRNIRLTLYVKIGGAGDFHNILLVQYN